MTIHFILSNATTAKALYRTAPHFRYSQNTSTILLRDRLNQDASTGHHGYLKTSSGITTKAHIYTQFARMAGTETLTGGHQIVQCPTIEITGAGYAMENHRTSQSIKMATLAKPAEAALYPTVMVITDTYKMAGLRQDDESNQNGSDKMGNCHR